MEIGNNLSRQRHKPSATVSYVSLAALCQIQLLGGGHQKCDGGKSAEIMPPKPGAYCKIDEKRRQKTNPVSQRLTRVSWTGLDCFRLLNGRRSTKQLLVNSAVAYSPFFSFSIYQQLYQQLLAATGFSVHFPPCPSAQQIISG